MKDTITTTLLLCFAFVFNSSYSYSTDYQAFPEELLYDAIFEGTANLTGKARGAQATTWSSTPRNGCEQDGSEFFGTRNGKFEITNYEGSGCDKDGQQGGANNNEWHSGTIDIKNYTDVNVSVTISGTAAKSGFENDPRACPPLGSCVDQISVFVSVDGTHFSKTYLTSKNEFFATFDEVQGVCGKELIVRVEGGTQAANESFFINEVRVTGKKGNIPVAKLPSTICFGDDAVMRIDNISKDSKIKWYDTNDREITGAENSNELVISSVKPKDIGLYTAKVVDNSLKCNNSVALYFDLKTSDGLSTPAQLNLKSGRTYACKGEDITFVARPNSSEYNYVWFGPDGNQINYCKDASNCRITDIKPENAGKYLVRISRMDGGKCSIDEASMMLKINQGSGTVSMVSSNPFLAGSTAKIKVKTENSGKYNYIWMMPDGSTKDATNDHGMLQIKNIQSENTGIYVLTVANMDESCASQTEYLVSLKADSKNSSISKATKPTTREASTKSIDESEFTAKSVPVNLQTPMMEEEEETRFEVEVAEGAEVEIVYSGTIRAQANQNKVHYKWFKEGLMIGEGATLEVNESGSYTVSAISSDQKLQATSTTNVTIKDRIYSVKIGDDLERVAKRYYDDASKIDLIRNANNIEEKNPILKINSKLIIPRGEKLNRPKKKVNSILLGSVDNFAPFSGKNVYKNGILTEITNRVLSDMNIEHRTQYATLKEAQATELAGQTFGFFPVMKESDNGQAFLYSEPLYNISNVLFTEKDDNIDFSKPSRVRGKTVAVVQGYTIAELNTMHNNKLLKIRPCKTIKECFDLLESGEVDMVATAQFIGLSHIAKQYNNMDQYDIIADVLGESSLHFAISKEQFRAEAIMKDFNDTYLQLKKEGVIRAIQDEHIDFIQNQLIQN